MNHRTNQTQAETINGLNVLSSKFNVKTINMPKSGSFCSVPLVSVIKNTKKFNKEPKWQFADKGNKEFSGTML